METEPSVFTEFQSNLSNTSPLTDFTSAEMIITTYKKTNLTQNASVSLQLVAKNVATNILLRPYRTLESCSVQMRIVSCYI